MSNILNELGVDEDDLDWYHLAACRGLDTNLFYDKYESDNNSEQGVWGGVYLNTGEIDKPRNVHKTQDVWKRIRAKNGIHK